MTKKRINVRAKGHSFERWCANKFRITEVFPFAKRHLEMQMQEADGIDLDNTGHFKIQCKVGKQIPKVIYDWYNKISSKKGHGYDDIETIVMKRDKENPLVVMCLDDFIKIVKLARLGERPY